MDSRRILEAVARGRPKDERSRRTRSGHPRSIASSLLLYVIMHLACVTKRACLDGPGLVGTGLAVFGLSSGQLQETLISSTVSWTEMLLVGGCRRKPSFPPARGRREGV